MISDSNLEAAFVPTEMDLLLFNAAGLKIAVDTEQVDCIISSEQAAQQEISCLTLSTVMGLGNEATAVPSTVILYKDGGRAYGISVDALDAIVTFPIKAIQPIPRPLSHFAGPRMFWGVVLHEDNVVLLIDLFRLKSLKSCEAAATA